MTEKPKKQKQTNYDMTQGNPARLLILFTIPMLIGNIFQQLYSAVDSIVVGRFVSIESMAAIGSTSSMLNFFLNMSIGLSNGLSIVTSQYFGARNEKMIHKASANALLITIVVSSVMGILGLTVAKPLLILLKTPEDILPLAHQYITIVFAGMICLLGYNVTASILRALGNSRTPLYFLIFSSILNIAADLLFVLVFDLGISGVAYATVGAQGVSAILSVLYMRKHYPILHFSLKDIKPDWEFIGRVVKIGLPMGLQSALFAAGMMVIQGTINSYGTAVVAGYTAGVRVENITWIVFTTLGHSISNYIGQNVGAKNLERIHQGFWAAVKLCTITCIASTLVVYVFGTPMLRLFITADQPNILEIAKGFLFVNATFYLPLGLIVLYNGCLRGMGDVATPMFSAFIELIIKVGGSLLLSFLFGYFGIWFAEPIGWVIAIIPSIIRYHRGKWKKKVLDLKV